jgi:CRP/FNR family transcriptional regulator, cyclic AMP receptor protein
MAKAGQVIALLAKTELFGGLSESELQLLAENFHEAHFGKGEMLFARGDRGDRLYLIADGRVRLATSTDEGRELSFRHATTGEILGEIAALDGGPRTAEAMALVPVVAWSLERRALRELMARQPAIAGRFIDFLCRRVRDTSEQLEAIALHPLHVRLARFLLVALGDRQAAAGKRVPLEIGFSQGELALLLGATRPKVNEAFGTLEQTGAIGRTIDRVFCDPAKLAAIARHDNG